MAAASMQQKRAGGCAPAVTAVRRERTNTTGHSQATAAAGIGDGAVPGPMSHRPGQGAYEKTYFVSAMGPHQVPQLSRRP
jgi:hypothetical protein